MDISCPSIDFFDDVDVFILLSMVMSEWGVIQPPLMKERIPINSEHDTLRPKTTTTIEDAAVTLNMLFHALPYGGVSQPI
jgi:hypothetical protein